MAKIYSYRETEQEKDPDNILGKDFLFYRADRVGTVSSRITVTAFDPERGWKLASYMYGSTWVTDTMFKRLLAVSILAAA